jgi:DNA-binding response OmpR family regulator
VASLVKNQDERAAPLICGDRDGRPVFTRIARRWEGVRMIIADDARTAMYVAAKHRPRLVILDDELPDVDAGQFVEHLRRRVLPRHTPVIVLSHDPDPRQRARFVWAGASAYFTKPLNVADVDRSVATLLEVGSLP